MHFEFKFLAILTASQRDFELEGTMDRLTLFVFVGKKMVLFPCQEF